MNVFLRILAAAVIFSCALALFSCDTTDVGTSPVTSGDPAASVTTAAPEPISLTPPAVYGLTVGDLFLYPGADPAVLTALGEPQDKLEAKSCVHEGYDRVYYYAGYEVNTQPTADGREVIVSVYLTDDSMTTAEGVRIGDTVDTLKSTYGDADGASGVYSYGKTDGAVTATVNFAVDSEGYITSIYYN